MTKFKKNDRVVFENPYTPNKLVMTVTRGNYKSAGCEMVDLHWENQGGKAFASSLRLADKQEIETGFRKRTT